MTHDDSIAFYDLDARGGIAHWLKCGTITSPLQDLDKIVRPAGSPFGDKGRWVMNYWAWDDRSKRLKKRVYDALPPFTWTPPKQVPHLHSPAVTSRQWEYVVTEEDQVVDFSTFNFTPSLMQSWTCAYVQSKRKQTLQAELLTIGPARIFLNGDLHTHYADTFSYVAIQRIPVELALNEGLNTLYLHGEMLGWREARLALGLRFVHPDASVRSGIDLGGIPVKQWQRAEMLLNALHIKQFAFPVLPGKAELSREVEESGSFKVRVELPIPENVFAQIGTQQRPVGESQITLAPGESGELPLVTEVTAGMSGMPGENSLILEVRPADGTPLTLRREIWAGRNTFSHAPYGDYESRRLEALHHLAQMPYDVPAALAALEVGTVDQVRSEAVALACHFMENRYDCADFYAIGLLALLHRYAHALRESDRVRIETAFAGFKFWIDEPGIDAMCYFTENHQILFHVTAYLSGQLWPERVFANSGWTGKVQMARARPRIEQWILRRLQGNFSEWDSNAYMTLDAFAMLALVEFADSRRLQEMATALLDKLFFLLACQSFRGAHASTHGRCYVTALKSARVENTSSLQRIAWGMGIFNGETRATGLLALAQRYRVPAVIQRIGADVNSVVVTRARSRAQFRPQFDMRGDTWDVRTLTYRTPEVMLSAALDYQPGSMGIQEHLWQATLGPEASVFTTYPGNSQEHGNARPNFWAGSALLPRVGMVERTVICIYALQPDVGLGISHAYFPTALFDEVVIKGQWAFARVDGGYIALWGDGDLRLTASGRHVAQELRSMGGGHAWLCRVGSTALDGSFESYQQKLLASPPIANGTNVTWTTPEGDTLQFGWTGSFLVNGQAENWDAFPHYANSYTQTPMGAAEMHITHSGETLRIDLRRGSSVNSP
jgi:hypothetical protein